MSKKVIASIMRLKRIRCIVLVGATGTMVFAFYQMFFFTVYELPALKNDALCRHPDLDITNPNIQKHIEDLGELKCDREDDWIVTRNGMAVLNKKDHGQISCKLNFIERVDDFKTKLGKSAFLTSEKNKVTLEGDFFHVKCKTEKEEEWKNLMAGIARNETLVKQLRSIRSPEHSMGLNVLMYGLDSMSRMHFQRKLPKTYKYLTEVLKASILKGYNIVGDGTPQALIPILTGYSEPELPETRKRMQDAQFVDVYPFVWKDFAANGYVTAWGEEQPQVGTFTYRLKGFKDQPTHHCMRSFYLKVNEIMNKHPKLCLANKPRHRLMLDWLREFYDTYPDVQKFGFAFNSELSHDDYNFIGYADPDIKSFLKGLHDDNILNNTLLIIMSDHGHRFAPIRASQQGKQEERLPFFSLVVPEWVEKMYPKLVQNLRINENRLVTPFDIYATFKTLLDHRVPEKGTLDQRSISLFTEIPVQRTCAHASIEPHWCACLSWFELPTTDVIASQVSQAVIDLMNQLTEPQRDVCEKLTVRQVTRLEEMVPNKALLTFKENADKDGFVGKFTDNTQVTQYIYQVQLQAHPSGGVYEAVVNHNKEDGSIRVKEAELSRVNMYGNQEHCIHDTFPGLRKYCYCKVQLNK